MNVLSGSLPFHGCLRRGSLGVVLIAWSLEGSRTEILSADPDKLGVRCRTPHRVAVPGSGADCVCPQYLYLYGVAADCSTAYALSDSRYTVG